MSTEHKLKSVEELSKHFCYTCGIDPKYPENLNAFLPLIKEFQQNAIDEGRILGMKEAAEIADKHYEDQNFNGMYRQAGYQINAAILAAVNKLEDGE
jgi:hypothetical protein